MITRTSQHLISHNLCHPTVCFKRKRKSERICVSESFVSFVGSVTIGEVRIQMNSVTQSFTKVKVFEPDMEPMMRKPSSRGRKALPVSVYSSV